MFGGIREWLIVLVEVEDWRGKNTEGVGGLHKRCVVIFPSTVSVETGGL